MFNLIEEIACEKQGTPEQLLELVNQQADANEYIKFFHQLAVLKPIVRRGSDGVSISQCFRALEMAKKLHNSEIIEAMKKVPELFDDMKEMLEYNFMHKVYDVVVAAKNEYESSMPLVTLGSGFFYQFTDPLKPMGLNRNGKEYNMFATEQDYTNSKRQVLLELREVGDQRSTTYLPYKALHKIADFLDDKTTKHQSNQKFKIILLNKLSSKLEMGFHLDFSDPENTYDQIVLASECYEFKSAFIDVLKKVGEFNQRMHSIKMIQTLNDPQFINKRLDNNNR